MKLGVFIAGRLGSERLPNKLILPLGDSCLWEMACKKLSELPNKYEKIALCYESELIEIAKKYPGIQIVKRDELTAKKDGPLSFIFKDLKETSSTHLMFLNPCLYNLKVQTIIKSLEAFKMMHKKQGIQFATSVKKYQNWLFNVDGLSVNPIDYKTLSTKIVEPLYECAHTFHIFNKKLFFKTGKMLDKGHGTIEIDKEETLDVDDFVDYKAARFFLQKKYVIDIDETICTSSGKDLDYSQAIPLKSRIDYFNRLYEAGNSITYLTARGSETGYDWERITRKQLDQWGVKYHKLMFGKPAADIYIDDKALNVTCIDKCINERKVRGIK